MMKIVAGITDQRSRISSPIYPGQGSRSLGPFALKTGRGILAAGRPAPDRNSCSDEIDRHLANITTQAFFSPSSGPIIAGFIISGPAARHVLLRAAGPALAEYGLINWLAHPRIRIFNNKGALIQESCDDPSAADEISRWIDQLGVRPFRSGGRDAALVATLSPGAYTAHVFSRSRHAQGICMVEAYELPGAGDPLNGRRLTNFSSLAEVASTERSLIMQFSVVGRARRRLLIRGIGPGLASHGVVNFLADAQVELRSSSGLIAINHSRESSNNSKISATSARCGAFPLQSGSGDAALLVTLDPGRYSIALRSASGSTGRGLIEVYEAPEA